MEEHSFRLDGAVIYWTAQECSRNDLESLTCGDPLIPARRHAPTILRESLEMLTSRDKSLLVRPTADRRTFAVVKENRDHSGNAYSTVATAHVDKWERCTVNGYGDGAPDGTQLRELYSLRAAVLTASQITSYLTAHVSGPLTGTRLKEAGGVYWIPDSSTERWRSITDRVILAATNARPDVYLIRHRFDADALRAVKDAITAEIENAAAEIRRDAGDPTLGAKAHQTRTVAARQLAEKARSYEGILGESLAHLTAAAQAAELAAATAAMTAAAAAARQQTGGAYATA